MNELNQKPGSEIVPKPGRATEKKRNKTSVVLITILIALVAIAAVWIWKSVELTQVKETAEQNRQVMQVQATQHVVQSQEEQLKLLAKAYVWAVRSEMMQGNINQINLFASDMVKEKNFQRIVIANDKGIIVSSTDKKDEGQPFSTVGNEADLNQNDTNVQNVSDSVLVVTSPIMGFNNRLGTLLIRYVVQPPMFK